MGSHRVDKIASTIREIVSDTIAHKLSDPRISPWTSVTRVEVAGDLQVAKVYVSVMGDQNSARTTMAGLNHAAGRIQRELARVLTVPRTMYQAVAVVRFALKAGVPYVVVGKGSNLIVRDGGYDGIIIKMGTQMAGTKVNKETVRAEGGASFALLSRKMTKMGRSGLEFGIGIPGTVGGAVRMNAGAFGGEVSSVLTRTKLIDGEGAIRVLRSSEIRFTYRNSHLPTHSLILSATFRCPPGPIDRETYKRSIGRKETQPISERSFGSTFVNPPDGFAAEMIEKCGLKGMHKGGAMVSTKHANFIINRAAASAQDIETLIDHVQHAVAEVHGIDLVREVRIVGEVAS